MRIRKHAKVSPLVYAAENGGVLQSSTTICELNQSPWDVMSFSPEQEEAEEEAAEEEEEEYSLYHQQQVDSCIGNGSLCHSIGGSKSVSEEAFCCKIDSKGWQCHRIAEGGESYCEHHRRRGVNPNGYYYYSGFGPLWGKRRGPKTDMPPLLPSSSSSSSSSSDATPKKRPRRKPIKARSLKSLM